MKAFNNILRVILFVSIIISIPLSSIMAQNQIKALIILPDQYGANYYLNKDNFERFGWDITITGLTNYVNPCPVYASPLGCPNVKTDVLIADITDVTKYDCVVVMSATTWTTTPPCNDLINNQTAINLIQSAANAGIVVAATCTGVRVLAAAGVINGKHVTGSPKYISEYIAAGANFLGKNHYPVIDGNIVTTAAGDFFNIQNCNAIARAVDNRLKEKHQSQCNASTKLETKGWFLEKDIITKTYGGINSEGGRSIFPTSDNGFIITGYTFSQGAGNADVLLIKTDSEGNQIWLKTFGGTGNDYGNSVCETSDGSYIISGFTTSFGAGDEDVYLIKTDADGNEIWQKYYGGSRSERANKIIETSSGNYLIAGFTESFSIGQDDVYILYTNPNGDTLWTSTKGDDNSQFAKDIIETSEGKFIIVGSSGYFSSQGWGNRDVYMLEYDQLGNCNYSKTYGESSYQNWGNAICPANDGFYMIAGDADITNQDLYQVYALKTKPGESFSWHKRFGEKTYYDYGTSVLKADDNNYIICGTTKSVQTNNDIYVISIDSQGNQIKKKIVGEDLSEWASGGCLTKDGKYYVVIGHTNSFGAGYFDVLFEKIPLEILLTDVDETEIINSDFKLMQNYPNPFNPSTTIEFDLPEQSDVELAIFNLLGQKVTVLLNEKLNPGNHSIIFNAGNLTGGVYFYRIIANNFINTKKFILIK